MYIEVCIGLPYNTTVIRHGYTELLDPVLVCERAKRLQDGWYERFSSWTFKVISGLSCFLHSLIFLSVVQRQHRSNSIAHVSRVLLVHILIVAAAWEPLAWGCARKFAPFLAHLHFLGREYPYAPHIIDKLSAKRHKSFRMSI